MSTTEPNPTGVRPRWHVRREAVFTAEQRNSLLVVASVFEEAYNAGRHEHDFEEEEVTGMVEDLREMVRLWDNNPASTEYWIDAEKGWQYP